MMNYLQSLSEWHLSLSERHWVDTQGAACFFRNKILRACLISNCWLLFWLVHGKIVRLFYQNDHEKTCCTHPCFVGSLRYFDACAVRFTL